MYEENDRAYCGPNKGQLVILLQGNENNWSSRLEQLRKCHEKVGN